MKINDFIVEIFSHMAYDEIDRLYKSSTIVKNICDQNDINIWKQLYDNMFGELHIHVFNWKHEYLNMYEILCNLGINNLSFDDNKYITPISMHLLSLLPYDIKPIILKELQPNKFIDLWEIKKSCENDIDTPYWLTEDIILKSIERCDPLLSKVIHCLVDNLLDEYSSEIDNSNNHNNKSINIDNIDNNICCRVNLTNSEEDINTKLYHQITYYHINNGDLITKYFDNIDIHTILYIFTRNKLPSHITKILLDQLDSINNLIYHNWDKY